MKIRFMVAMVGAVLLGYFLGKLFFQGKEYETPTFYEPENVYFLQQGVYSSYDSMAENVEHLEQYLYREEEGKYYVYFGITSKEENAEKVKNTYEQEGTTVYIKAMPLSNEDFLSNLVQYDILLSSSDTKSEIDSVLKAILASYREFVVDQQ